MSREWKIILDGENVQNKIIQKVKNKYYSIQQLGDINQFISPYFMSVVDDVQYQKELFQYQSSRKLGSIGMGCQKNNERVVDEYDDGIPVKLMLKDKQITIKIKEEEKINNFEKLIINIEDRLGKKLNENGINKLIEIIRQKIQKIENQNLILKQIKYHKQQVMIKKDQKTMNSTINSTLIMSGDGTEIKLNKENIKKELGSYSGIKKIHQVKLKNCYNKNLSINRNSQ